MPRLFPGEYFPIAVEISRSKKHFSSRRQAVGEVLFKFVYGRQTLLMTFVCVRSGPTENMEIVTSVSWEMRSR